MNKLYKDMLKKYMVSLGFNTFKSNFYKSKSYSDLNVYFEGYEEIPGTFYKNDDIESVLNFGKSFIIDHVDRKNIKVPYLSKNIDPILFLKYGKNPSKDKYMDIINDYSRYVTERDVYRLPVYFKYNKDNSFCKQYYPYSNADVDFQKLVTCSNYYIEIGFDCFNLKLPYVHEMYHAMLKKGFTKNYLYDEFISTFEELVCCQELSDQVQREADIINLNEMKYALGCQMLKSFNDVLDARKYITSILLAYNLFDIYKNHSNEVNSDINRIIGERMMIEDLIEKYGISEENGVKILEKKCDNINNKGA